MKNRTEQSPPEEIEKAKQYRSDFLSREKNRNE